MTSKHYIFLFKFSFMHKQPYMRTNLRVDLVETRHFTHDLPKEIFAYAHNAFSALKQCPNTETQKHFPHTLVNKM